MLEYKWYKLIKNVNIINLLLILWDENYEICFDKLDFHISSKNIIIICILYLNTNYNLKNNEKNTLFYIIAFEFEMIFMN